MTGELILGLILCLPLLIGLLFRAASAHIFFAVMAGELLGRYLGHDLDNIINNSAAESGASGYGEIILIILPIILTAYFMRRSIRAHKLMLHVVPLAATGIILGAFILPVLPAEAQNLVTEHPAGNWLLHLNKVIISGVIILQLVYLWIVTRDKERRRQTRKKE